MKQAIVFIDSDTFYTLLADDAFRLGFTQRQHGNYLHLNGDENVYYVQAGGHSWSGEFEESAASKSIFLLVPDDFELNYSPKCEFIVLHHTRTPRKKVDKLSELPNFRGDLQSYEEKGTIYDRLAQQIISGRLELEPIWKDGSKDHLSGIAARVLANIRHGDLGSLEWPDAFTELTPDFDAFRKRIGNYFDVTNPVHMEAFARFKSVLLNSLV